MMLLLRRCACWVVGHAPIVERRGNDSVLLCERCGSRFEVFVAGLYVGREAEAIPPRPR